MTTVSFDTLQAAEALQANGFTAEQAKALVEVQRKALTDFESSRELATKNDILLLRQEMRQELASLRAELIKWMVGSIFGLGAFLVAVMAWLRP